MSKRKFVLGALFGAVAGVVAGVLTAPKSGKETRADLKKKANKLKKEWHGHFRRTPGSCLFFSPEYQLSLASLST